MLPPLVIGLLEIAQQVTGIINTWRESQGMTKEELVALARQKDAELGNFIETELAMLDKKQGE